jgi:hypothetical protein
MRNWFIDNKDILWPVIWLLTPLTTVAWLWLIAVPHMSVSCGSGCTTYASSTWTLIEAGLWLPAVVCGGLIVTLQWVTGTMTLLGEVVSRWES